MQFVPAYGPFRSSYGDSTEVTEENAQAAVDRLTQAPDDTASADAYIKYFNQSSDGLRSLLFGKDARTQAAILAARLKNLKADRKRYAKIPVLGKAVTNFLDGKIRLLQAEYDAVTVQAQEEQYTANTKLALGTIGTGLAVLGGLIGLQYILLLRAKTRAIR